MNVLLVEDETALADVMARNLRARHHDVVVSATAEAASAHATQVCPGMFGAPFHLAQRG